MSLMFSRKGRKRFPFLSGCAHTGFPLGSVIARGSLNPRTPRSVPKVWSKDRFSCIKMTMCSASRKVVPGWGSIAIARRIDSGNSPVAPIPDNIAACLMKSRREVGMVTILCVDWKGNQSIEYARVDSALTG